MLTTKIQSSRFQGVNGSTHRRIPTSKKLNLPKQTPPPDVNPLVLLNNNSLTKWWGIDSKDYIYWCEMQPSSGTPSITYFDMKSLPAYGRTSITGTVMNTTVTPTVVANIVLGNSLVGTSDTLFGMCPYNPNWLNLTPGVSTSFFTSPTGDSIAQIVGGGFYIYLLMTSGKVYMQNVPSILSPSISFTGYNPPSGTTISKITASGNFVYISITGTGSNADTVYYMNNTTRYGSTSWSPTGNLPSGFRIGQLLSMYSDDGTKVSVAVADNNSTNQILYNLSNDGSTWTAFSIYNQTNASNMYGSTQRGLYVNSTNGAMIYDHTNNQLEPIDTQNGNVSGPLVFAYTQTYYPIFITNSNGSSGHQALLLEDSNF